MTRSELIERLAQRQPHLSAEDVATATRHLLDQMSDTLARGERIEVRGFGSFDLRYRRPRFGHNPKTREPIALRGRYLPHFKPGIELCTRVNGFLNLVRDFLQDDAPISDGAQVATGAEFHRP
jgi:integration host factor subunit beta